MDLSVKDVGPGTRHLIRLLTANIHVHEAWTTQQLLALLINKKVVKVICRRFSGIRQGAPVCTPPNTWLLWPTRVHNPNGISTGSAIFAQLTAVLSGMPGHPLKIATSHWMIWTPSNIHGFYFVGPTRVQITNDISIGSAVFAQLTAEHH